MEKRYGQVDKSEPNSKFQRSLARQGFIVLK